MEEAQILDELRFLIRAKFCITTITPTDCNSIANKIRLLTKKNISEMTIKRIFGFTPTKYSFSQYTLSQLSDCNAELNEQLDSDNWRKMMVKTKGITNQTLLDIKNECSIPDEHICSRKFAEQHFNAFLNRDFAFTCFISPPGWGKTTILSQLARGFLSNPANWASSILFLTACDFLDGDSQVLKITDFIKKELGIDSALDLMEYIDDICGNSKLVIFIDGFNNPKVKPDIKRQLFEGLHQFSEEISNSHIQLVMGMRSTDWAAFVKRTNDEASFRKRWFPGPYFDPENNSNIPILRIDEINEIVSSINGSDTIVDPKLKRCLGVPMYLQSYYELRNGLPNPHGAVITSDQIITHFIKSRVNSSNYFTEKMYLINKIIDHGKGNCGINEDAFALVILIFGNAYKELLSDGILIEKQDVYNDVYCKTSVHFARPCLQDFFIWSRGLVS